MFDPRNPDLYQPYAPPPPLPNQGTTVTPPQANSVVEEQYKQTQDTTAIINEINNDINKGATSNLVGAVQLYWGAEIRLPDGWTVCDGSATLPDRQLRVTNGITKKPNFEGRYPKGNNLSINADGHVPQPAPTTYKLTRDMVPWKPLTISYGSESYTSAMAAAGAAALNTQSGENSGDHTHELKHSHAMKHRHAHTHSHKLNSHTHGLADHTHGLADHTHSLQGHTHGGTSHDHFSGLDTGYNVSASGGTDRFAIRRNFNGDDHYIVPRGPSGGIRTEYGGSGSGGSPSHSSTGGNGGNTTGNSGNTAGNNDDSGGASATYTDGSVETGSTSSKDNADDNTKTTSGGNSVNHTHSYKVWHNWTEIPQGSSDDLPYFDPYHQEIMYVIYEGAVVA